MKKKIIFLIFSLILILNISCSRKNQSKSTDSVSENVEIPIDTKITESNDILEDVYVNESDENNDLEEDNFVIDMTNEESDSDNDEVQILSKILFDKNGNLKIHEFDSEKLNVSFVENQFEYTIVNEKDTVRLFYDENYRLSKKEKWEISDLETSRLFLVEKYLYSDSNETPSVITLFTENEKVESYYDNYGKKIREKKYIAKIENDSNTNNKNEDETKIDLIFYINNSDYKIEEETYWLYDEKNRVVEENTKFFNKKDTTLSEKKLLLVYNDIDEITPPDSEYYENGILINSVKYFTSDSYEQKIYFDDDFVVTTIYENYIKVRDVYSKNGSVIRVKNYEKTF